LPAPRLLYQFITRAIEQITFVVKAVASFL
jgi:hypothetical protein